MDGSIRDAREAAQAAGVLEVRTHDEHQRIRLQRRVTLEVALDRYALIYGTDQAFDLYLSKAVPVRAIRLAHGNKLVKAWLAHERRRMVLPENIVFDPTGRCGPDHINLFEGWPVQPAAGDCEPLLDLLAHLVSQSAPDAEGVQLNLEFVLRWIALPLQQPGTKMRSALVVHGPQGSGKSLFFESVKNLYGRYGKVIGQSQIESRYNDWASCLLFAVADEVLAVGDQVHYKNPLKSLITGETLQIESKFQPTRQERNQLNICFLSNETRPLALEADDRRHFVIWCPEPCQDGLYDRVRDCLDHGGLAAFLHHLLTLDLGDFHAHTPPPMTAAKRDLVELGLKPSERFTRDWLAGQLDLPVWACSVSQLYRAFRRWCTLQGERVIPNQNAFSASVAKFAGARLGKQKCVASHGHEGAPVWLWVPDGCSPPNGVRWFDFATESVAAFDGPLTRFGHAPGVES